MYGSKYITNDPQLVLKLIKSGTNLTSTKTENSPFITIEGKLISEF